MSATAIALLGFAGWSLLLVILIGSFRSAKVQTEGRAPNSFSAAGDDLPGFGARLTRAHANTYEFLPVAGAVMLVAIATANTAVTDGLAYVFLAARLLQSVVHLLSTAVPAVFARFAFFLVQVAIVAYWIYALLMV